MTSELIRFGRLWKMAGTVTVSNLYSTDFRAPWKRWFRHGKQERESVLSSFRSGKVNSEWIHSASYQMRSARDSAGFLDFSRFPPGIPSSLWRYSTTYDLAPPRILSDRVRTVDWISFSFLSFFFNLRVDLSMEKIPWKFDRFTLVPRYCYAFFSS